MMVYSHVHITGKSIREAVQKCGWFQNIPDAVPRTDFANLGAFSYGYAQSTLREYYCDSVTEQKMWAKMW